jgi:hypothetical protein
MREDVKDLFDKERNILFIFAYKEWLEAQLESGHDSSIKEALDAFHGLFEEYGVS